MVNLTGKTHDHYNRKCSFAKWNFIGKAPDIPSRDRTRFCGHFRKKLEQFMLHCNAGNHAAIKANSHTHWCYTNQSGLLNYKLEIKYAYLIAKILTNYCHTQSNEQMDNRAQQTKQIKTNPIIHSTRRWTEPSVCDISVNLLHELLNLAH